jgi:lipoprotein-anchoring transpeptidase ErfK/SrfK
MSTFGSPCKRLDRLTGSGYPRAVMRIPFLVLVLFLGLAASPVAAPAHAEEVVSFRDTSYFPGTIVVKTGERRLYLVLGNGKALRYVVGVGKQGKQWSGQSRIVGKYLKPAWSPPPDVKRDNPSLPDLIEGGAPNNPMGAAAMVLAGGEYAIHGTNRPKSIGGFVSYGCIRMHNRDIVRLFDRVHIGTPVVVIR